MLLKIDTNPGGLDRLRDAIDRITITLSDLQGVVLRRLDQEHRAQERRIFSTEGAEGGSHSWPPLHPEYAAFKEEVVGVQPMLVWDGTTRGKFINRGDPDYVSEFVPRGASEGVFLFGARSEIAAKHFRGEFTTIKPRSYRSRKTGKRVTWPKETLHVQLPVRDMVTKSAEQIVRMRKVFLSWFLQERVPQIRRAFEAARRRGNGDLGRGPAS